MTAFQLIRLALLFKCRLALVSNWWDLAHSSLLVCCNLERHKRDHTAPAEHFVFLSEETMPFCMDPRQPHVPPDFTLGLADVSDWPAWAGEAPWILDPKERPKPVHLGPDSPDPEKEMEKETSP